MTPQDLKDWRARMDLTQAKAAELLGYRRAYYSEFETGGRPIPTLIPWACAAMFHRLKPWPE